MMPKTHGNGVPCAAFSASFRLGNKVHTGEVGGSIPSAPTNNSSDLARRDGVPTGSFELMGALRLSEWIEVPLSRGLAAKIDAEDAERVLRRKWSANAPQPGRHYAQGTGPDGRLIYLHRFILDAPRGMMVDHINGDTLDCRRNNLRLATPQQNSCNARRRSALPRGVTERPGKRYQARIKVDRRMIHIGYFDTLEAAAKAYDAKAAELHGEFAVLNFPTGDQNDART